MNAYNIKRKFSPGKSHSNNLLRILHIEMSGTRSSPIFLHEDENVVIDLTSEKEPDFDMTQDTVQFDENNNMVSWSPDQDEPVEEKKTWYTRDSHPGYTDYEFMNELPKEIIHIGLFNFDYNRGDLEILCRTETDFVFLPLEAMNNIPEDVKLEYYRRISEIQNKHHKTLFK